MNSPIFTCDTSNDNFLALVGTLFETFLWSFDLFLSYSQKMKNVKNCFEWLEILTNC